MQNKIVLISLAIFLCVCSVAYYVLQGESVVPFVPPDSALSTIVVGGTPVKVSIVRTPAEQEIGLSGRQGLAPNHGMLFAFQKAGDYRIWMKDMRFAIDVLWIDEGGRIVNISEALSPSSYPTTYGSQTPALYVLELPAGFVERYNISRLDKVDF